MWLGQVSVRPELCPVGVIEATYAGYTSAWAAWVAARDEYLYPDGELTQEAIDDPDDPDLYDCAYWSAAAYAGFESA